MIKQEEYLDNLKIYPLKMGDCDLILGDENIPSVFKAHIKLLKWNKENSLSIGLDGFYGIPFEDSGVVKLKNGDLTFYADKRNEEVLKFGFIFDKKPSQNYFIFKLDGWEDFDFHYQPPLTKKEKDSGNIIRAEDVVGSYAVYHKTKRDYIKGKTNYLSGKFCHFYRPKFIDKNGNFVWADLNIKDGFYKVTIPESFLENAVYPIIANDTFGVTTIGGTTDTSPGNSNVWALLKDAPASSGNADTIFIYQGSARFGGSGMTVGLYLDAAGYPTNLIVDSGNIGQGQSGWITCALDSVTAVHAGSNYWMGMNTGTVTASLRYDSVAGFTRWAKSSTYVQGSLANPFPAGAGSSSNIKYSIYTQYTASGGVDDKTASPSVGNLRLVGYTPTITRTEVRTAIPSLGTLRLVSYAPTVSTGISTKTASPSVGNLRLVGYTPTVTRTEVRTATPSLGTVRLVSYTPTVSTSIQTKTASPSIGNLRLESYAPTVSRVESRTATPSIGNLQLTSFAPGITRNEVRIVSTQNGILRLVSYSATASIPGAASNINIRILLKSPFEKYITHPSRFGKYITNSSGMEKKITLESELISA